MFEQSIIPMLKRILSAITGKWKIIPIEYGVLALAAAIAVPLKLFLFYYLIGVKANFFFVWLITVLLTYLLFASIRNKWIPAVVYLLLSVLMLCDVTYSSFFNRYLSVSMIGAAGVLGNITDSIKEVLKPWFFLILADAVMILAALAARQCGQHKINAGVEDSDRSEDMEPSDKIETFDNLEPFDNLESFEEEHLDTEEIAAPVQTALEDGKTAAPVQTEAEEETALMPGNVALESDGDPLYADAPSEEAEESAEVIEELLADEYTYRKTIGKNGRSARLKNRKTKKEIIETWLMNHKKSVAAFLILVLLVFNFTGSFFITSLSNQEIYSFHIKDLIGGLTGNNGNSDYMYSFTDSYQTEKNGPLFGVAKGRNLIVIQIESLQNIVINKTYNGQEITPNLNQIIKDNTIYFDHYYQQIGSGNTSDAEFATNNSVCGTLASYTYKLYPDNYFRGLPKLLKEQGYETAVYHAHEDRNFWNREEAYESLGFDTYYGGIGGTDKGQYDMTEWMGWGLTDSEFFKQSIGYLKEMTQPFYSFIITLSNHHPYKMLDKYQFIDLLPEDEGTIFGNYLNSAAYTDYSIGLLMQELKDEGIYDNSIIAFYGDHMGLPKSDEEIFKSVSRFLGKDYDFDTMMNIPLIITIPEADQNINQTVGTTGGQIDFLPTIAYLMGFDTLDTIYLGHNLLSIDSGFVAEQTYMTKGSFFQDDIVYEMSRDGVFENGRAWNPKTGEPVPVKACYDGYLRSMGTINTSDYILKNDVLRKIYLEDQDAVSAFSSSVTTGYPDKIAIAGVPDLNLMGTKSGNPSGSPQNRQRVNSGSVR